MNPRLIVLIVAMVGVALLTAYLAREFLLGQPSEPVEQVQQAETARILVAAQNLPMGHLVEAGDLTWAEWPTGNLNANYLQDDSFTQEDFLGNVVRYGIVAGEPLTTGRVIAPGEKGFLAAVLSPGMRAVTIPITRTSGLAGFVFPGDRVDLILTQSIEVKTIDLSSQSGAIETEDVNHQAGVTIVKNVRVLAVDTRTDDQNRVPELGKSVTLEVTPQLAERLAVAQRMGQIVLSLRSNTREENGQILAMGPEDEAPHVFPTSHTWDFDVSDVVSPFVSTENLDSLVIARGSQAKTYIIGVDGLEEQGASDEGEDQ